MLEQYEPDTKRSTLGRTELLLRRIDQGSIAPISKVKELVDLVGPSLLSGCLTSGQVSPLDEQS